MPKCACDKIYYITGKTICPLKQRNIEHKDEITSTIRLLVILIFTFILSLSQVPSNRAGYSMGAGLELY